MSTKLEVKKVTVWTVGHVKFDNETDAINHVMDQEFECVISAWFEGNFNDIDASYVRQLMIDRKKEVLEYLEKRG